MPNKITIGTRGSQLALYQAHKVKETLLNNIPSLQVDLKIVKTKGDKILDVSLSKIGDKGLFTKELEVELINGTIDLAVHSLKDMPTTLPYGLKISAVLERGESRDALVSKNHIPLNALNEKHTIATSSLRRRAALLKYNPNINIVDIRGNVNTRLQRMADGHCDAMIMAAAGLQRLKLEHHITEILPHSQLMPAVSQGIIGIEIADQNHAVHDLLQRINHVQTWLTANAERSFMQTLQGGCQVPVGCFSTIDKGQITMKGFVASEDGKQYLEESLSSELSKGELLGQKLAQILLDKGGRQILKNIRPI